MFSKFEKKKKERNRSSCRRYYPDEIEESAFGAATEEEQLALIDVANMRNREDRVEKLYAIFPNEIVFSWEKGRVEFSARLINILCYAYGQGRTNVRSCLGSYFKRKGYHNMTVRSKNTGMIFVQEKYIEREKEKQEQETRKIKREEKEAEMEKEQRRQRKRQRRREKKKSSQWKKRKKNTMAKEKNVPKDYQEKNPKMKMVKKIVFPNLNNKRDQKTESSCLNLENQKHTTKKIIKENNEKNELSNYEQDFFSLNQSPFFWDSFWTYTTSNSDEKEKETNPKRKSSLFDTSIISEIKPKNDFLEQFQFVLPYQFETEGFPICIPNLENVFEYTNMGFHY
ncbi:chascon isoform d-related [Anaeramoeba flamelloides]|uniref:Chascon isoform d-related n=1 Tax=Anaeramoeba flamelloides TaxID=1746091 RepID=A0AAV7YW53_9EUKA|nr:chascon isoform d-related [Anaeramoeba flamelloides]